MLIMREIGIWFLDQEERHFSLENKSMQPTGHWVDSGHISCEAVKEFGSRTIIFVQAE